MVYDLGVDRLAVEGFQIRGAANLGSGSTWALSGSQFWGLWSMAQKNAGLNR